MKIDLLVEPTWEDSDPVDAATQKRLGFVQQPPPEPDPTWEESTPIEDAGAAQAGDLMSDTPGRVNLAPTEEPPTWEESEPADAVTGGTLGAPTDTVLSAPPAPPPRGLIGRGYDLGKEVLRQFWSPISGPTEAEALEDYAGRLMTDPKAAEAMFKDGKLTTEGRGAWDALMRGVDQLQGTGYGIGMAATDAVGADTVAQWLFDRWEKNKKEIEENPPAIGEWKNIGAGIPSGPKGALTRMRQFRQWLTEAVFQNLPTMAIPLGGGAGGGYLAKKLVARGLEKKAAELALKAGAKRIAAGQLAGAYAGSVALETGQIYEDMVDRGVPRTAVDGAIALFGGLVAGAGEVAGPFVILRRFGGKPVKTPVYGLLRSTLGKSFMQRGVVKLGLPLFEQMTIEGGTEGFQTAVELAAAMSRDPKVQDAFWDAYFRGYEVIDQVKEATRQGAAVGVFFSAAELSASKARSKIKSTIHQQAFDAGVKSALENFGKPKDVMVQTKQGTRFAVPTQLGAPKIPRIAGIENAAIVDQAVALGLNRTAAALAGQPKQPVDLTIPQMYGDLREPAAPPAPRRTLAAAQEVVAGMKSEVLPPAPAPAPAPAIPVTADNIATMDPAEMQRLWTEYQGPQGAGMTGMAYGLGASVKSPADVQKLRDALASAKDQFQTQLKAGNFDEATQISQKSMYLNEAISWATGEGGKTAQIRERVDPNYTPPFPTVQVPPVQPGATGAGQVASSVPAQFRGATAPTQPSTPGAPVATPVTAAQPAQAAATASTAVQTAPGVSPAPVPATGMSRAVLGLRSQLENFFPHLGNLIEVVETGDQFPEAVKADYARRGIKTSALDAVYYNGRVIFNASRFPTGNPMLVQAKGTHELPIHLGLRVFLGPERFNRLSRQVWKGLTSKDRLAIMARNGIAAGDVNQIGEEWLAYESERVVREGKTNGIWARVAAMVRRFLRTLRIGVKFSDLEIAELIAKGMRGVEAAAAQAATPEGAARSPLAQSGVIRFSFADVERATLEGERKYIPESDAMDMADAFDALEKVLHQEARILSDLIPPSTPWHQPTRGMSLIEYMRQYLSPEGIGLLRQTFAGERPPRFVKDVALWHKIKDEINTLLSPKQRPSIGLLFLSGNDKTGGVSLDFILGTCMPTEACAVCYARNSRNPIATAKARVRHTIAGALYPEQVADRVSDYINSRTKGEMPFLRANGSGDSTFPWQATLINRIIARINRPVHIFSRSHVSRAEGTIGLDSISNGHFNPDDIENGVAVYKMGSIDPELIREYGIPFLRENLEKRGIVNSYLVKDVDDIPHMLELKRQGVFFVMHVNAKKEVVRALDDAGLLATTKNLEKNPGLVAPACPCALQHGPYLNGCATCLVSLGVCWSMGSMFAMSPKGELVLLANLLSGKSVPPAGPLAEMSRIGVPAEKQAIMAEVAAGAYATAAEKIMGSIAKSKRLGGGFYILNPRDKTPILRVEGPEQYETARLIAEDWRGYADSLRELVKMAKSSPGFSRLLAAKQLTLIEQEQKAITDYTAAIDRAAQSASRASVSEGEAGAPEPIAQTIPSAIVVPGLPEPPEESGADLNEHDENYATRASVTPLPVSNEGMEQALAEQGLPPLSVALGKPDKELLAKVQWNLNNIDGWIDSIIERQMKKPGLLTDEETLGLDYYALQLRTRFFEQNKLAEQAEDTGEVDAFVVHTTNAENASTKLQQLAELTRVAGTEAGRAFRARQHAVDWDFNLSTLIGKKREANGWRKLTQEEIAHLAEVAKAHQEANARLEAELKKLRERDVDAEIAAAKAEIAAINPKVLEYAKEWVADIKQRAKNARDRFKNKWEKLYPGSPIRASLPPGVQPLPDDLMRELAIMGAAKLAENITDQAAWEEAMVDDTTEAIRPHLADARVAAEAFFQERLAAGRAEARARRAPRRVPGTAPAEPTPEEKMDKAKSKIAQIVEKRKGSTEPIKTAEDDLYYAVQALVREVVEQNPIITRDELVTEIHNILLETMPEISREETMDAISGRGRVTYPDPETIAKTIRDLKAQIRIASHILDIKARRQRKPTGLQRDKPSDEQRHLIQVLNELKRRLGEVVTNPGAQLQSYLDSRKTWYRNRMADLRHEIATRELIVKTKSPERTDAELEDLKAEYARVREEHQQIFVRPELTPEQRLELAEQAAQRIILKMEADLAAGRKTASRQPSKLASAKLEALRTRIIQLKAEQEWAERHMNPPPDLTDPADIKRWFNLERSISKIEQQLANKTPFARKRVRPEDTPTNVAMQARLEDLKRQRKEMRQQMGPPKPSPLEQAIAHKMAQLKRQIADYQDRIANRDFTPRKRKEPVDISTNDEAVKLEAQRNKIQEAFFRELEKDRYARKTRLQKIGHGIQTGRRAMVNLKSSFDFSGMRQALLGVLSLASRIPQQPIRMTKKLAVIFYRMFRAAFSRDYAAKIAVLIKKRNNWKSGADKVARLELTDIEAPKFTWAEENARSVFDEIAQMPYWTGKPVRNLLAAPVKLVARGVAGSNRNFATFLNLVRVTLFDELLETNFKDRAPTENELRVIGNWVNVATGRGKMNPLLARAASEVVWAPKLLASRLQFLLLQPLWGGGGGGLQLSGRARWIVAKEYARVIGTGALLAAVASMFDEKKERDPRSSDYGKIVRGNTRIDIWGGLQQATVIVSRLVSGKTKTIRGNIIDLTAKNTYAQGNLYMVIAKFGRTKLRPDWGVAMDIVTRQNFRGEPVTLPGVAEDLLIPLPFAGISAVLKDRGWTEGAILEAMNQFGAGVSVYEPEKPTTEAWERRTQ